MHLALFVHSLSMGGVQRRTLMLANQLASQGHRIDLVTVLPGGIQENEVEAAVTQQPLLRRETRDVAHGAGRSGEMVVGIPALASYLRHRRPDLLLGMANHAAISAALAHLAAGGQTKLVLRASNHLSRRRTGVSLRRLANRLAWRRADGILAVSEDVAADIKRVTGIRHERIHVVPSPILPADFDHRASESLEPRFAALPPGEPLLLAIGRFVRQKGFDTLLDAFAQLLQTRPAARLVLVGDGPDGPELLAQARKLGIAGRVEWPGLLRNPFPLMRRADLFVLSSRWEGMPAVLVEALACGCPIVSTDCPGGPRELLDGLPVPLVPVDDATALASAMADALDRKPDPDLLRGHAARFGVAQASHAYEAALLSILAGDAADAVTPALPLGRPS